MCVEFNILMVHTYIVTHNHLSCNTVCTFLLDTFIDKHTLSLYLSSAAGVDLIRTTVCQAELLVRKKMKQYLGLVTEAEGAAEDSNCNTTAEDLQVQ